MYHSFRSAGRFINATDSGISYWLDVDLFQYEEKERNGFTISLQVGCRFQLSMIVLALIKLIRHFTSRKKTCKKCDDIIGVKINIY